jgi:hypothetical protein
VDVAVRGRRDRNRDKDEDRDGRGEVGRVKMQGSKGGCRQF